MMPFMWSVAGTDGAAADRDGARNCRVSRTFFCTATAANSVIANARP